MRERETDREEAKITRTCTYYCLYLPEREKESVEQPPDPVIR